MILRPLRALKLKNISFQTCIRKRKSKFKWVYYGLCFPFPLVWRGAEKKLKISNVGEILESQAENYCYLHPLL